MEPSKSFIVNPGLGVWIADLGVASGNVLRRAGLPGDLFSRGSTGLSTKEYFGLRVLEWPDAPRSRAAEIETLCDRVRAELG